MKAEFQATNPDVVEMRLTVTMKLSEWKELRTQLNSKWPSWQLGNAIDSMVRQAEERFYAPSKEL